MAIMPGVGREGFARGLARSCLRRRVASDGVDAQTGRGSAVAEGDDLGSARAAVQRARARGDGKFVEMRGAREVTTVVESEMALSEC